MMKNSTFAARVGLLLAGAAALIPSAAYAQDEAPAPATDEQAQLDAGYGSEIVVTAQGRVQRLNDVPISASVASGEAIQSANLIDLQAVTASIPSVRISPGPGADNINIRGVGSGVNAGFEQSVSTFVDGAYRGRGRSVRASLFDVERVEVLKGPQTTFFGNNAIAGAFNIVTKKPGHDLEYNISALYAPTDDEYSLEAGVSMPLSDTLAIRVAGKLFGMNGYTRNAVNDKMGPHMRDFIGRASIHWEPTATWEMDARVDYGRNRDTEQGQYQLINCPPPEQFGAPRGACATELAASGGSIDDKLDYHASVIPSSYDYDFVEAAMSNRWDFGSVALKSITSYFHHDFAQVNTVLPVDYEGVGGTPFVNNLLNTDVAKSYSQELRLESESGGAFEWMVGAYYSRLEFTAQLLSGSYFAPFGLRGAPYYNADTPTAGLNGLHERADTRSVFASATIHLLDPLRLNLGARYSSVHKEDDRSVVSGSAFPLATFDTFMPAPPDVQIQIAKAAGSDLGPFDHPRRTDDKFMPSVSLQYDLTPDIMTYASYTKGFKAGGYALNTIKNEFDPETVDAYEVGLKGTVLDGALNFALAAYRSDYHNLQESTADFRLDGSVIFLVKNVATSRSQGIDFSANLRANDWVQLHADIGYLDAVYTSFPNGACTAYQQLTQPTPCVQDLSGKRKAFAPEWSGSVGATFTVPAGPVEFRIDPLVYFTSSYYGQATADPELLQEGYAKVDLRIAAGPKDRRWEVALIGKNLTDEVTASYRNSLPTSPGTTIALVERPRSVAIQLTLKH
jgi:outer membrane receptor protein involved in Fe transport